MATTTTTGPVRVLFADDHVAAATAAELQQRLQLVAELAEHSGINRASIEAQLVECRKLHLELGAHLAIVALA